MSFKFSVSSFKPAATWQQGLFTIEQGWFVKSVLTAVYGILLSSCGEREPTAGEKAAQASQEKMKLVLDEIESRVNEDNLFLSDQKVKAADATLEKLNANQPFDRAITFAHKGWDLLCLGKEKEAIASLEASLNIHIANPNLDRIEQARTLSSLALAYFRMAETQNCCAKPGPESCIFPLRNSGIHSQQEWAGKALDLLSKSGQHPGLTNYQRSESRWLANVAAMTLGMPIADLPPDWRLPKEVHNPKPKVDGIGEFKNIAAAAGVDSFSLAGGAVMDDFDGDGFYDLLVSSWDPRVPMRYFKNQKNGTFEELTEHSTGLQFQRGGPNLKQADYDNDGDIDVYVMRGGWLRENGQHPNSLLRNDGPIGKNGAVVFTDVTFATGLGESHHPSQTADWADFDLDGDLDLFVGNETFDSHRSPCQLFRNDGPDARGIVQFTDIAAEAGVENFGFTKGVAWGDYDGDRFPDLAVSNLFGENRLYRNRGDGTFENVASQLGAEGPFRSFPVWFWDDNNDGHLDLFITAYQGTGADLFAHATGQAIDVPRENCRLLRNDGHGKLRRVEHEVGLTMPMLPMGSNFGDLQNDGFPDIYLGTGNPNFATIVPNILLSNRGEKFHDETVASRMGHLQKGHAVSFADFDRDGDLDIFEQMGGAYPVDKYYDALYENPGNQNSWVSIKLEGVASNRSGIGARVRVIVLDEDNTERSIFQWMNSGGSFGANPLELHFGLGDAKKIAAVEIFWPVTGKTQRVENVNMNQRKKIREN